MKEQIKSRKIKIIKDFEPCLPKIAADMEQLSDVFSNLIINACDAMPKGGQLRVITRLSKPEPDTLETMREINKTVEIEFADTGKGIPEECLSKIFDPFFTTKRPGKGVGLGLSICYGIIEMHKGSIETRSEIGKGATFIIRLPVKIQTTGGK